MHPASPDLDLGHRLRCLRVQAGLDVAMLARRVSLSPAQVAQLESGEGSLFYNRRIRHQAARKIAIYLGADPDAWIGAMAAAVEPATAPPVQLPPRPPVAAPRGGRMVWTALAVCMLTVTAVLGAGRWSQAPSSSELTVPASADLHAAAAVPEADSCPPAVREDAPRIQPPQAARAADMVYVVSKVDQVVCLFDASGRQYQQRLQAGQSRSFYGQPPWVVQTTQLRETQLYFQGWKVRLPEGVQDQVQLVEWR